MIKWTATKEESALITKIAQRAVLRAIELEIDYDLKSAVMDVEACHCNGTPLQLAELLNAKDGDFGHDVFGIRRFINRETGKLEGIFVPRCAQPR